MDDYSRHSFNRKGISSQLGPAAEPVTELAMARILSHARAIRDSTFQCILCFDLSSQSVYFVCNYQNVLGHRERDLNLNQHQSHVALSQNPLETGMQLGQKINRCTNSAHPKQAFQIFSRSRVGIFHKDGRLLETQQISVPIQLDKEGRLVRYMSIFSVVGELLPGKYILEDEANQHGNAASNGRPFFCNPFTPLQSRALKIIADSAYPLRMSVISQKMGLASEKLRECIEQDPGSVLSRAETHSNIRFLTVYQVAEYFRGLLIV